MKNNPHVYVDHIFEVMLLISTGTETMSKLLYMDRLTWGNISGDPFHPTFPYIPLFIKVVRFIIYMKI